MFPPAAHAMLAGGGSGWGGKGAAQPEEETIFQLEDDAGSRPRSSEDPPRWCVLEEETEQPSQLQLRLCK